MKRYAVPVLIGSGLLFFAWIGFLLYLALTTRNAIVLSRSQFLVSELDVTAHIETREGPVTVVKVHHSAPGGDSPEVGAGIEVTNLEQCLNWNGPGDYLLPLRRIKGSPRYEVVEVPLTPGYLGGPPRIYPANPSTLAQLEQLPRPVPAPTP